MRWTLGLCNLIPSSHPIIPSRHPIPSSHPTTRLVPPRLVRQVRQRNPIAEGLPHAEPAATKPKCDGGGEHPHRSQWVHARTVERQEWSCFIEYQLSQCQYCIIIIWALNVPSVRLDGSWPCLCPPPQAPPVTHQSSFDRLQVGDGFVAAILHTLAARLHPRELPVRVVIEQFQPSHKRSRRPRRRNALHPIIPQH